MSEEKNKDIKDLDTIKHSLYTGKISEFKSLIKYIPGKYIKQWDEEGKLNDIARGVKSILGKKTSGLPRTCGEECEIKLNCPFYRNEALMPNEVCPIELGMSHDLFENLYDELSKDRAVNMSDIITIIAISTLYVIANFRITSLLNIDGIKSIGTVKAPGGGIMEVPTVNPLMEQYINIIDQIQRLTKSLHLHRLDRNKYKVQTESENTSSVDINTIINILKDEGEDLEVIEKVLRRFIHVQGSNNETDNKKSGEVNTEISES